MIPLAGMTAANSIINKVPIATMGAGAVFRFPLHL